MNQKLNDFAQEYKDIGTETSKYRKYRERYSASIVFGIISFLLALLEPVKSLFSSFPYPNYAPFLPACILFLVAFVIFLGRRDMDVGTRDVTYYEIASSIEAMKNNNVDGVLDHLNKFKDEANRNSNDIFSQTTEKRIEEYYNKVNKSDNPAGVLEETFNDFMNGIIRELSKEDELDQILEEISPKTNEEFEGSVLVDATRQIDIDVWSTLTVLAIVGSILVFNTVGKDTGYYTAVISLSAIQILSNRGE